MRGPAAHAMEAILGSTNRSLLRTTRDTYHYSPSKGLKSPDVNQYALASTEALGLRLPPAGDNEKYQCLPLGARPGRVPEKLGACGPGCFPHPSAETGAVQPE